MSETPASPQPARLLIVDDVAAIHADFRKILLPRPDSFTAPAALFAPEPARPPSQIFEVDSAYQGEEALRQVERAVAIGRPYAVAFVDMRMPPGWDGIETIRHLWQADPFLQIVICTAYSDYSWEETVRNLGESDNWVILKKPFDNIEVLQLAHALTKKWLITRRDRERLASLDAMVRDRTAALLHSEGRFVKAFHANPIPVALQVAFDGRYLDVNDAFLRLIGRGRAAVLQRTPAELQLGGGVDLWQASLRSIDARNPLRAHRAQIRTATGAMREVIASVEPMHVDAQPCVFVSLEDITERLQLEEQLHQSQKMEAVGQLAAGVAHDFNNLLTVIQSYASLALDDPAMPAEHRAGLTQVCMAADRAGALTRQMLIFSRRQVTQTRPLDLASSLASLHEMLSRVLPAQVQLDWRIPAALPAVRGDEANLTHVLMNLIVNARDALLPRGGQVTLEVRAVDIDRATAGRHVDARPGRFVCLAVRDNGAGIPPEILPRIFEPFFTTKPAGEGTGLGLSTVYAIVRQHEGWIEVASARGEGTTFQLFLPALEGAPLAGETALPEGAMPAENRGHGEHILLVEDDEVVRQTARRIAIRSGYKVTDAADAPGALAAWASATESFDLLLTDMVMPNGPSGVELAKQLRARAPGLKVILSTGYSPTLLTDGATQLSGARLLLKPYTADTFLTTLRETLDARGHETLVRG